MPEASDFDKFPEIAMVQGPRKVAHASVKTDPRVTGGGTYEPCSSQQIAHRIPPYPVWRPAVEIVKARMVSNVNGVCLPKMQAGASQLSTK